MTYRVAITGMSGVTSLGSDWEGISANLKKGITGVRYMPEWQGIKGLNTKLGAPVAQFEIPSRFKRKQLRSASRVARLALAATEGALKNAELLDSDEIASEITGVAYGSAIGGIDALAEFAGVLYGESIDTLNSTSYIRMMPHTAAVNISIIYKTQGRLIPASSACTSGSLSIGYAYEAIKHGYQKIMLAGGAEEFSVADSAVFDVLYCASSTNDRPEQSPRPFDKQRDGLVIGEGAATLVLEELQHARDRGAQIFAELIGFGTNSDGRHLTQPSPKTMELAMKKACDDAQITPSEIGYISAHATATQIGDVSESMATEQLFGRQTPISSLKSYFGHTLGACGAIEAWLAICGMNEGWFPPTQHLTEVDPECAMLDYIVGAPRELQCDTVMSNNFAFGGLNTSLVFRKYP